MNQNRNHLTVEDLIDLLQELTFLEGSLEQDRQTLHSHRCDQCNHVWSHTGANAGNEESHMCPECNTGPHWYRI